MLVMTLPRRLGRGAMSLSSHDDVGIAEAMLSMARCHCQGNIGHCAMSLPSHAGDGATESTLVMALLTTMLT
jgi:hypothetical protein